MRFKNCRHVVEVEDQLHVPTVIVGSGNGPRYKIHPVSGGVEELLKSEL
jgi:hypothetical protein